MRQKLSRLRRSLRCSCAPLCRRCGCELPLHRCIGYLPNRPQRASRFGEGSHVRRLDRTARLHAATAWVSYPRHGSPFLFWPVERAMAGRVSEAGFRDHPWDVSAERQSAADVGCLRLGPILVCARVHGSNSSRAQDWAGYGDVFEDDHAWDAALMRLRSSRHARPLPRVRRRSRAAGRTLCAGSTLRTRDLRESGRIFVDSDSRHRFYPPWRRTCDTTRPSVESAPRNARAKEVVCGGLDRDRRGVRDGRTDAHECSQMFTRNTK